MGKHKKTLKEKIVADYRRQIYTLNNNNMPLNKPALAITINESSYFNARILKDILKTGILTFFIIALQIVLFFLLKRHILSIPNLNY